MELDFIKTEIDISSILSYKVSNRRDYSKGGFYYILNTTNGFGYVGKSIDFMARLKSHIRNSANKSLIDKALKENINDFKFYLLSDYGRFNINFFNRKLELIIEHRLITFHNTSYPNGYNLSHYGNL